MAIVLAFDLRAAWASPWQKDVIAGFVPEATALGS